MLVDRLCLSPLSGLDNDPVPYAVPYEVEYVLLYVFVALIGPGERRLDDEVVFILYNPVPSIFLPLLSRGPGPFGSGLGGLL